MATGKYANMVRYERALPANLDRAPSGSVARFRPRVGAARAARVMAYEYAPGRQLAANFNRAPVIVGRAISRGIEPEMLSGGASMLRPGVLLAAELQGALAGSVWDMYLTPSGAMMVPSGAWHYDATYGWMVTAGAVGTVSLSPNDPGRQTPLSTAIGAYYDLKLSGAGLATNQWQRAQGTTPQSREQISPSVKRNYWDFNIPWQGYKGVGRISPFYPAYSPAMDPAPLPRPVTRSVEFPNLDIGSAWTGVDVYGRNAVPAKAVFRQPAAHYDPQHEKLKVRSKAYALFKALEDAGDAGTLMAAWYQAARMEYRRDTGRKPVSWASASWEQRFGLMAWGLTHGVDYAYFAERTGMWWIGERLGAILGPTVRLPNDPISGNVRLHNLTSPMKDMM